MISRSHDISVPSKSSSANSNPIHPIQKCRVEQTPKEQKKRGESNRLSAQDCMSSLW